VVEVVVSTWAMLVVTVPVYEDDVVVFVSVTLLVDV
jgi:hypothetical protein